jgi:hypothetical protein
MAMEAFYLDALNNLLDGIYARHLPQLSHAKEAVNPPLEKQRSRALSAFGIAALFGLDPEKAGSQVVDDYDDFGIDALHWDPATETLYLVQCKHKPKADFGIDDVMTFANGIAKIAQMDFTKLNKNFKSMQSDLEVALMECRCIQPVVVHSGNNVTSHAIDAYRRWQPLQDSRIAGEMLEFGGEAIVLHLLDCQAYKRVDDRIHVQTSLRNIDSNSMIIGTTSLKEMARLLQNHGLALFAKNIRQGLGMDGEVNQSILRTIRERPELFVYLNNGVTVLASEAIARQTQLGFTAYDLKSLSVVNGAQTITTALEALRNGLDEELARAFVTITIVKIEEDDELGRAITKARNHQNAVKKSDFVALDPLQEELRRNFSLFDIDYVVQSQASDSTRKRRIWVDEVGIGINFLGNDPFSILYALRQRKAFATVGEWVYKVGFAQPHKPYLMYNGVQLLRFVDKWMMQAGESAGPNTDERHCCRNGRFHVAWILFKRFKAEIEKPRFLRQVDFARSNNFGREIDLVRQQIIDAYLEMHGEYEGLMKFFGRQDRTIEALLKICSKNFGVPLNDPVLVKHRLAMDGSGAKRLQLFSYLLRNVTQINL